MRALRWPGRGGGSRGTIVGLAFGEGEVAAVALVRDESAMRPRVLAWDVFPANDAAERESGLRRFVAAHGLRGAGARLTLAATDYDLKLVERPANVPDAELADATRWLIRDLVEIDVESASIAALTIPDRQGRGRTPHMFVVAARDETTTAMARMLAQAGLACAGFEVVETAMLALESSLPESVTAGAMVRVDAKSSNLILASEGRLFLARPLRIDATSLDAAGELSLANAGERQAERDEALEAAIEPLVLDVQRSLDYYESEYGRAPATRLTLLPGSVDLSPLAPALTAALRPLRVAVHALEDALDFAAADETPPSRHHPALALAAGAALAGDRTLAESLVPLRIRAHRGSFALARVLQTAVGVALALALLAGLEAWRLHDERRALAALDAQQRVLTEALARATAEATPTAGVEGALDASARLRERRDAGLALLRDLGGRGAGEATPFSALLTGLARQDLDGVWLERIELREGGTSLSLEGRALRAEDVPALLRRLHAEPAFAGRSFGRLEIERPTDDSPGLRFHVATRAKDEGGKP